MFEAYRVPRDFMPFWHFGARMGIATVNRFLHRMRVRGHSRLLDAGTGGGANVLLASWAGFDVTACDLSSQALRALQHTLGRVTPVASADCVRADSCALPFSSGAFDVVIASHIIEHLDHPAALLLECARVLRPGGVLRVSCPSRSHALRIGVSLGLQLDPEDHVVQGYEVNDIAALLPKSLRVTGMSYQGRFVESNCSDAQFYIARALGMSGNPAVDGAPASPPVWLFALKEFATLPLLVAAKLEDALLHFVSGSMISVEIEKSND
ncbi:MAG TPA: class I SAM-dependent methyltransferase [Candidatus Hydrogenedentes bacterium]|nr:class I SAM-dependent methyltransferase [Candidatus Hydrogenedentota bacterium]HRK35633.1 class I SAM-dependent methyltransferase [Candidatus Hydrogenedentota bacterium]